MNIRTGGRAVDRSIWLVQTQTAQQETRIEVLVDLYISIHLRSILNN